MNSRYLSLLGGHSPLGSAFVNAAIGGHAPGDRQPATMNIVNHQPAPVAATKELQMPVDIRALREKRAAVANELRDLTDKNQDRWNASLTQKSDALISEVDALDGQIAAFQAMLDRTADDLASGRLNPGDRRGTVRMPSDVQDMMNAIGEFARTGDPSAMRIMGAALTEDPTSGGPVVPAFLFEEILSRQKKKDPLRQVARVETVETAIGKVTQPLWNGTLTSAWVGEGDTRTVGSMDAISAVTFPEAAVSATIPISSFLDQDSRIGEFVVESITDNFAAAEGLAFVSGSGTKQPLGFLSSPQATTSDEVRPLGTLQTVVAGTGGTTITSDLLTDVLYALKPSYRANATFAMNSKTLAAVRKLKDTTGQPLWTPSLMAGQPELILGRPVIELESMPDIGAGSVPVAVGDWSRGYFVIDRNMVLIRDPYTVKGQILFYAEKRVSGSVVDSSAIKLLKLAAS